MDEELRTYLREMEERMESRFDAKLDAKLDQSFTRWSQFILHEMDVRFNEVNTRLESIDSRLKLHAGMLQSGARAVARLFSFSESSEERWVDLATRVAEIERKLDTKR
jgi:hypothetical protein